jgi:hypothetical protein
VYSRTDLRVVASLDLPRLILVTGSGPGTGKSSMSDALFRRLRLAGKPVQWIYESDLFRVDALKRFNEEVQQDDAAALDSLLAGVTELVALWRDSGETWIVDSLVPGYFGFFWLLGRYPLQEIEVMGRRLWQLLELLHPLIVYLRADATSAYERAIADRGDEWGERMARLMQSWPLSHYPPGPMRSRADMMSFLDWADRESRRLLAGWPGEMLVVDTTDMPLDGSLRTVLSHLRLPLRLAQSRVDTGDLSRCTGRYLSLDEGASPPEIEVGLAVDDLRADLHWPSSYRLVPESGTSFRLETTTWELVFDVSPEEQIRGLSIRFGWRDDTRHRYRKADDGGRPG